MSNQFAAVKKIKALKPGTYFTVATEQDRQAVSKLAKSLKAGGVIEFDVITKAEPDGGFKVAAI